MSIEHLPETRRELLRTLKFEGPATISQLAQRLSLSAEGIRQQLAQLQRDRWVEAAVNRDEPGRAGRPPALFRLSTEGEHLFPKSYDRLNVAMMDAVDRTLGAAGMEKVLGHVADEWVARWDGKLDDSMNLAAKLDAVKSIYQEGDGYMEVGEDKLHLVERNCPYLSTALDRPVVCCVTVNVLSRLLGAEVKREKRFQDGHGCCTFRVDPSKPVPKSTSLQLDATA